MTPLERELLVASRAKVLADLEPYVIITLQKQTYKLEFDNKALKAIMAEMEFNLLDSKDIIPRDILTDPTRLAKLVGIGLRKHHPAISEDIIDLILGIKHYVYVVECLREAMTSYYPDLSDLPPIEKPEGDMEEAVAGDPPM